MTAPAWVAIALFVIGHIASAIWFAASISSRMKSLCGDVVTIRDDMHAGLGGLRVELKEIRSEFGKKIEDLLINVAALKARMDVH